MAADWAELLGDEFSRPYMAKLRDFLATELDQKKIIYPDPPNIFKAFELTPFSQVRVVILGQDPYHGPNQAHGLAFSVEDGVRPPPSLKNIFKELKSDLGLAIPKSGNLTPWALNGVFLLNTVLTVQASEAGSHRQKGWEIFTDRVISLLNEKQKNIVFLLWGSPAIQKRQLIDEERHLVLTSPHPSPLSAHRGFFGQKHFSKANSYLRKNGRDEVNWQLSDFYECHRV